ncbi:PAS domain S-box protein, partial [Thermodesulfobacteriota bacterium]
RMLLAKGVKSAIVIPLFDENKGVGTLNVGSVNVDGISEYDRKMLASLAPHLALALKNAILYEELHESEFMYRTIVNSTNEAIYFHTLQGEFLEVNDVACEMLGYEKDELLKLRLCDVDTEDTVRKAKVNIRKIKRNGRLVFESEQRRKGGNKIPVEISSRTIEYKGKPAILSIVRDITERKKMEEDQNELIRELKKAVASVKTMKRLLPICSSCKKIRDDKGYWSQIESYISRHTDTLFSHSICPCCAERLYPELYPGLESTLLYDSDEEDNE